MIEATDVEITIEAQTYRTGRLYEWLQEEVRQSTILTNTLREKVGQANGLSVIQMGKFMFSDPSQMTAHAHLTEG